MATILIAREVAADKLLESSGIAVSRTPEIGGLPEPALDARALWLAVPGDELLFQLRRGFGELRAGAGRVRDMIAMRVERRSIRVRYQYSERM